jgi:hypothetical protein
MGAHLDPDTLAAFAERSLSASETNAVFAHLAECETCRAFLAANGELSGFRWNVGPSRLNWPLLLKAAVGIALFVSPLWFLSHSHHSRLASSRSLQAAPDQKFNQVTLGNVSFVHGRPKQAAPAFNQISLQTSLGKRWVTVDRVFNLDTGMPRRTASVSVPAIFRRISFTQPVAPTH